MSYKREPSKLPKIIERQEDGSYTLHDQIIFFVDGSKRTIKGVRHVWENTWTHLITANEQEWIINPDKVLCIQRYKKYKEDKL